MKPGERRPGRKDGHVGWTTTGGAHGLGQIAIRSRALLRRRGAVGSSRHGRKAKLPRAHAPEGGCLRRSDFDHLVCSFPLICPGVTAEAHGRG